MEYKIETLFTAVYIFDTYLATIGHWNFSRENLCLLSVTSVLLASKFDEPVSPNFKRMLRLLKKEERKLITVKDILQMEQEILTKLSFDLNFPNPISAMERYLRLLEYDQEPIVSEMAF